VTTVAKHWWSDDDTLLAAVKEALNAGREVPRDFIEGGKSAYTWRTIDAELAALTYDSKAHAGAPTAVTRTETATLRSLTFASESTTIELEITQDALLGQVAPAQAGAVSVRVAGKEIATVPVDELGFFMLRPVPDNSFRLLFSGASGTVVLTGRVSP
jgi:hypothetical protein